MPAFKYNMQPGMLGANLEDVGATCVDRCSVTRVSFDASLYSVLPRKRRGRHDTHAHIHAVCKSRASPGHSLELVEVLLYVYRNRRFIRGGSPGRPPRLSHSSSHSVRAKIINTNFLFIIFCPGNWEDQEKPADNPRLGQWLTGTLI